MLKNLLITCTLGVAALAFGYSLSHREVDADFTYVNPSGIHTLDPARMSWTQDFRVALNLWEGLTTWDPQTLEPIEGVAQFPPQISEDRLTYTFTIRKDAYWSNGDRVTAADFVRGWRRALEPGTATDYTFLLADHIAGAKDYVQWRRSGVAALTTLSRLAEGWQVDGDRIRELVHLCRAMDKPESDPHSARPRADRRPDARFGDGEIDWCSKLQALHHTISKLPSKKLVFNEWEDFARRAIDSGFDFRAAYDEFFDDHVDQFERRFSEVGIEAVNDQTLIVRLIDPCPYFLDLTGFPTLLPCHESIELLRDRRPGSPITAQGLVAYDPQWTKPDYAVNGYPGLVTNGAYRLQEWVFKRRARLTVNPYHRLADRINCRTIDMLVYDNVSAAIMAYEAGDVDFLPDMNVPYDHEIARLARTGARPDFHLCSVQATYFFNFNCQSTSISGRPNPFADARVRKAFALSVDKDRIVNNVLGRGDRVAHSFVPPASIGRYDPPNGLDYDPVEARRLLKDAGYGDAKEIGPIEFLYTPNDQRICQAVARMWEETLGVSVNLRCKESKTFAVDKAHHRYMVARANWYADYNDPTTFLDCLVSGNGNNDSGYSSVRYDSLMARARRVSDPPARSALLRQAERIIVEEDFPILPILHYTIPIAISPRVRGLYPNARLWFPFYRIEMDR